MIGFEALFELVRFQVEPTELVILSIPAVWYAYVFGLGLLVVSFFIRSIVIYIAIILCMVGVIVGSEVGTSWVKASALMMIVWCGIAIFKSAFQGERG